MYEHEQWDIAAQQEKAAMAALPDAAFGYALLAKASVSAGVPRKSSGRPWPDLAACGELSIFFDFIEMSSVENYML